ncbi:mitochondrial_DNA_primase (plasmid) [Leishmania braziliensis MHOM/BR/75/M2904]|uniref:Mitochondrial_DNA_primase n=1 Tax=Leishmania braziliensis MHOM/BR/75/M2904 TaxID=420245 RepID=A0A3P3Z766_LEIBR|nr:mitochondrial_DNA_primase [Leishmania braziliensis MHOM/BR/75/M2904]
MRRSTSLLLFKGAFNAGQKRPINASASAAVAAAMDAAGAASRPQVPPPPRQASTTASPAATTAVAVPRASMARPASLVTPPSALASSSDGVASAAPPTRKKKIIRRIIKRKKVGTGATAGEAMRHAAAETVAQAVAPREPTSAASTAAQPLRRGLAMLNEIRKLPEGSIEEEPHDVAEHYSEETATAHEQYDWRTESHPTESQDTEEAHQNLCNDDTVSENISSNMHEASSREAEAAAALGSDDMDDAIYNNGSSSSRKTPMVKGYRIDEVAALCSSSDAMFARRLPSGGCQFFAWPGTPLSVASSAIVSMPDTIRTVHAVFGRVGTPIDIVMDIDSQVPQEYWSMSKVRLYQRKVLDDVLTPLKEEIEKIGERIETQVVLQSPNLKKASFHIHTRLKDAAFADFYSLHGFLFRFQERLPNVDLQIYRPNGMLRMFSCMKENRTSAIVVFDEPKWHIGFPGGKVSDEQAALHSICVRDPSTFSRVLTFESPRQYNMPAYGGSRVTHGDSNEGTLYRPRYCCHERKKRQSRARLAGCGRRRR